MTRFVVLDPGSTDPTYGPVEDAVIVDVPEVEGVDTIGSIVAALVTDQYQVLTWAIGDQTMFGKE